MPTIHFRGPMLYVFAKGTKQVTEIVMPRVRHGGSAATPHGGAAGQHADHAPARPHWSGILFWDGGERHFVELDGPVTIEAFEADGSPEDGGCTADDHFLTHLPLLDRIVNGASSPSKHLTRLTLADGAGKYWSRVAARIPLASGTLRSGKDADHAFHFPHGCTDDPTYEQDMNLVLDGLWEPAQPTSRVRIRCRNEKGDTFDRTLEGTDKVYFYTYDHPTPSECQLMMEEEILQGGDRPFVDVDFKWIYQTLKAPGDDLGGWLGGTACGRLPAPEHDTTKWILAKKLAPDVSTCYPAGWQE